MRRAWSWVLAGVLLAAHTLGSLHGVAHARLAGGASASSQSLAAAPLGGLFKTHDDGGGCRLFDQLSHGDAAPTAVLAVEAHGIDSFVDADGRHGTSAIALAACARGPPVLA